MFKEAVVKLLAKATMLKKEELEKLIEQPIQSELGDYAFPCFTLAKQMKKSPQKIAEEISKKIKKTKEIKDIKANGPYLNFYINDDILIKLTLRDIFYGKPFKKGKEKRKILIEYNSPNTNKPLHLGHLRNMMIGSAVSNILMSKGNTVIQVNMNNDRGIHICKSMLAYKKYGKKDSPKKSDMKPDHFVGKYYVMFNEKVKQNPKLNDEARKLLLKWEAHDKETRTLWKKMNEWAYEGFNQTYKTLGIRFDKHYYESSYYTQGKDIIRLALSKGLLYRDDDGNIVAPLKKYNLPDKIVLRADGTAVYATQDLALAEIKFRNFSPDLSIYVVASEQNLYFRQLFAIFDLLNLSFASKCYHLSYGMVYLPEGKMKSREGTVVDADDLIEEIINLAKTEIQLRHKNLGNSETEKRAKIIGLAALRFYMLKIDPARDITFDPKESISFDGETGPYLQYVYARISSILRKYGKKPSSAVMFKLLKRPEEIKMIKLLQKYSDIVDDASIHYRPSIIAHYLLNLGQAFNEFYHYCPVISDDKMLTKARILLVYCVQQTVKNGLALLGIDVLEEM